MKSTVLLLVPLALAALACDPPQSGTSTETGTVTEVKTASLEVKFVSGHLGNTWDCSGQGVSLTSSAKADEAGPAAGAPAKFADCREDGCGGPLNCEDGSLVLEVTNTGEVALTAFEITDLELLTTGGDHWADLGVKDLQVVMKGDELEPGGKATLRVTLTAPESSDLGHNGSAKLRVIVLTGEKATGEVTSPEVQSLGMIAT